MKLGYPCINRSLSCQGDRTFRLKSYSEDRFRSTVENNLECLLRILEYNVQHHLLFFRITSDLIPFASHPVCTIPWQELFHTQFHALREYIKRHHLRISMHPDQFIVLNSPRKDVVERSIAELQYHADVLDRLGLDTTAKIQLHVGGVYGDKPQSMQRYIDTYSSLPSSITRRLVIENDEHSYTASDCLALHNTIDVPILFDWFHHTLHNAKESIHDLFSQITASWSSEDGLPMVDYSSQKPGQKPGRHAEHINMRDFSAFLHELSSFDFDVMLEIKDKERSALAALQLLKDDTRFVRLSTGECTHG